MSLLAVILPVPPSSPAGATEDTHGKQGQACVLEPIEVSPPQELDAGLAEKLGEKIVGGWLAGRRARLFPLNIDLASLDDEQRQSLVHIVICAATSSAPWSDSAVQRVSKVLEPLLPGEDERAAEIERARTSPRALHDLLDARDTRVASLFYSLSLLAIDRRSRSGRHYLRFLAARLGLPADVAWQLERRYRL